MRSISGLVLLLALCGCGKGPGPLEGTWRMAGPLPMTVTFRSDEAQALGDVEKAPANADDLTIAGHLRSYAA